ncbi:MAG: Uma2 family endonuclease [Polyangiaceae bacterium]|nr:Uma2 family endonuclease [Polyangiaceae bacterium]
MRATLRLPRQATYADYLAVEQSSDSRHELINGVIVAMAGGSDEHNALAARLAMLVGARLPSGCRYYSSDQRFWIPSHVRARYADGSVIFGKPEHPPHDDQATTNPRLVLEVLSPSSEGNDEGDKRIDFQTLASLQAYVLVHQDQRRIRVYTRDAGGGWRGEPSELGEGESMHLPLVDAAIAVADVYAGILDLAGRSLIG